MTSPEEVFIRLIPKINQSFSTEGKGRKLLFEAFTAAGLPFEENDFPSVFFDGSIEQLGLLFPEQGYYRFTSVEENTIFGYQARQIIIHPQSLYLLIQEKLHEMPETRLFSFIIYTAAANAIDAIVTNVTNSHEGENEELRDAVMLEFIRLISPTYAEDFQNSRD